jgi:hypothetical protein
MTKVEEVYQQQQHEDSTKQAIVYPSDSTDKTARYTYQPRNMAILRVSELRAYWQVGNAIDCLLVGADIHGCPPRTIDAAVNFPISAHAGKEYRQSCQSSTTTD